MRFRASLRFRVTLAFALLGLVVSMGLAGTLYVLTIDLEKRLIAETLSAELEDYIARYEINPTALPPSSTSIRTYVTRSGADNVPAVLRKLKAGLHEVQLQGRDYYAEVRLSGEQHFIVLYDNRQIRHREDQFKLFIGIGILVMTLLSAFLGLWLAGRVVAPVGALAMRVAGLHPGEHPHLLTDDFPHDEVGRLARDFDAYQHRLTAFIEREQAFTADISHELRTPLAVIEGAAEVLLDDPELDDARRLRVERIARSAHEMSELVTALLLLAREQQGEQAHSGCAVEEVLQQVVDSHRHMLKHKPVTINLDIQTRIFLPVERTLLRIVLANLVRNALSYTEQGSVIVSLDEKGVSVRDTGIGIPQEKMLRVFDRFYTGSGGGEGIGLSLVKRICRRYDWNIDIDSREGCGTSISLSFSPTSGTD